MKKILFVIGLSVIMGTVLFARGGFAHSHTNFRIIGAIPNPESTALYQIQVGSFKAAENAEAAFERLTRASLNPVYENSTGVTKVLITGISAKDMAAYLKKIQRVGFSEVIIREDTLLTSLPVSTAALPSPVSNEIGYRVIKAGETKSIADLTENKQVVYWSSSTPSTVTVDSKGDITGMRTGNALIYINETEYISIVVVPMEDFYVVQESQAALLPSQSRVGNRETHSLTEYRTEPTFRLAYRFNNKGESKGASGRNGGIDILGRGKNYTWLWTTYYQGGWFYDLNGVRGEMVNGYQKDAQTGVELRVLPEFIYDKGVPYLQLKHTLSNTNTFAVVGQKFGASADVMIHENDFASLLHKPYGAYMTDSVTNPALELIFVAESGNGITPVDTLWLGIWDGGAHLGHIYDDNRTDVDGEDTAIGFSYQNINLEAGETREFIVRFTLVRNEDAN